MSSSFEKSVKGATKIKAAPPKSKYVEHILLATNSGEAGVAEVFRTLQERLRDSTWTIVFKSLIIVHLMIKEGEKDATLKYLSQSPRNVLAINSFTNVQTQGQNIQRYSEYLIARAEGFARTKVDYVRAGSNRMKNLTIDKGLLRETKSIQSQIKALVKCDLLDSEPENEISLTAFRLLTKDLLDLFAVMNEAVMNVLSHYFELSKPDAEYAIMIYKTFAKQTDQVVQYLSIARQYERVTKLEIPKIKHAPTSLAASLQEYIDDKDFEINRRQYLAEKQAKGGKDFSIADRPGKFTTTRTTQAETKPVQSSTPTNSTSTQAPAAKVPASNSTPDMIDFFGSIEPAQPQQAPPVQQYAQQPFVQPAAQPFQQDAFAQNYSQAPPNGQSTNPFGVVQNQVYQQQPQPVQPDFTGAAGFGGYGIQTQQTGFPASNPYQTDPSQPYAQQQQPTQPYGVQQTPMPQIQEPAQQQMAPPPATNPFRQSMLLTGQMTGVGAYQQPQQQQQQQQSRNPFAKTGPSPTQDGNAFAPAVQNGNAFSSIQNGNAFAQAQANPPQLQPQPTGTNPFARQSPPAQQTGGATSAGFVRPNVTGSTNPFRQSMFVNQQTGQGWQASGQQGTMGGWEQMETQPVFPRPGQAS